MSTRRRRAVSDDSDNNDTVLCPESPILISPSPILTGSTGSYNNNDKIPSTSSPKLIPKLSPRSSATIPIYNNRSNHNHNSRSSSSPSRLDPGGSRGTNTRPTTKMTTKSMTTASLSHRYHHSSSDKQHHHDHNDHNDRNGHNGNNGNNGHNGNNCNNGHNGHNLNGHDNHNPKQNKSYRRKKKKMGVVLRTLLVLVFICILSVIALHRHATQIYNSLVLIDDKPITNTNTNTQQQRLSLKQQRLNQKDKFLDYAKNRQERKVKEIPEQFKLISIFDKNDTMNNNNSNNTTSIQLRVPVIVDQKEILRHISFTYNDEIITKESMKSDIKLCNYQPFRGNQLEEIPKLIKSYDYYQKKKNDDENRFVDDNKNDGGLGFPAARRFDYVNANYNKLHQSSKVDFLPPSSSPISKSNPDIISSNDPNPDNPNTTFDKNRYRSQPQLYSAAVCQIRPSMKSQLLQHFVHAMEELLKCFDYWIECNSNSGKYYYRSSNSSSSSSYFQFQPILLYEETQGEYLIEKGFQRNPFLKGIYELLTTSTLNVIVMSTNDYYGIDRNSSSSSSTNSIIAVNNNSTKSTNKMLPASKYYHINQTIRTYRSLGENGFLMLYNQEWNILMDDYLLSLQQLKKKKIEKEALEKQRNDEVNLQKFMKMKIEQDALEKQRNDQVNIQRNHVKNLLLQSKLPPTAGTSEELPKRTATKRKVALKCPKHKKPGDAITFTNPHNPGQKLRVKVPKACFQGETFKVTVPVLTSTLAAANTSSSSLQTTNTSTVQSRRRLMRTSSMMNENTDSKGEEVEQQEQQQQKGVYYGPATTATATVVEVEVDNIDGHDNDNDKKEKSNHNNEDNDQYLRPPRVGILNRKDSYTSGRTILNWKELAYQLSKISYVFYNNNNNHNNNNSNNNTNNHTNTTDDKNSNEKNSTVQVTFFEGKTFEEQIQFFRNTDILISPHGAQLTGLIFMSSSSSSFSSSSSSLLKSNSDYDGKQQQEQEQTRKKSCKHIMELFPKNYAIPYYFGSLAVQSGIRHSYVYYDDGITKINITETDGSKSKSNNQDFDRNKDNTDNDDPLDAYNKKLKRLNKQIRYSRNPSLKELMPWERIIPKDYIKRRNARTQVKFCPRQNDMNNMVIELIMDWYKCRRRRLLVVDNVR